MCLALLLTSCATALVESPATEQGPLPFPGAHGLRIGVEYLPPADDPLATIDNLGLFDAEIETTDELLPSMTVKSAPDYGPPRPTPESLSPYEELVRENHALVSIAARAYDVGRVAAQQVLRILRDGATPGDLPIERVTDFAYVVNMDVARRLNIFPPVELLQVAETIN